MNYVEAEGNSIDDAIERALQHLGVTRDKVDIEIVSNSTRGLFGLGGRRAKVRATLRRPIAFDGDSARAPAAKPEPVHPDVGSPAPPPRAVRPRAPQAPVAPAARAASPPRPEPAAEPARASRAAAAPARPRPAAPAPSAVAAPNAAAGVDPAAVERGRAVLAEIVRLTGVEASVEVMAGADAVRLVINGDPSGVLIGRRGQTLDAVEYLVNRIVAHEEDGAGRFIVDSQGYRERRRQSLEDMAQRMAERARRRGKPVTLNPMSPRDRRIVHLALQGERSLTTRSWGKGFYRKLLIIPEGSRRPSRPRRGESES